MQRRTKTLMAISGAMGFGFFLAANWAGMAQSGALVGCVQVAINAFVFLAWRVGYKQSTGWGKRVALVGMIVPVAMATITIFRVLLPAFMQLLLMR